MPATQSYLIELDGLSIQFDYQAEVFGELLDYLFRDIRTQGDKPTLVAHYVFDRNDERWRLHQTDGEFTMHHQDPVEFSLPLLNHIMRHFSDHNRHSITLHSALVSDTEGSILMPGAPGSGKSMACLWLTHLGLNYHTDEMVTINRENMSLHTLTRPFTLRRMGLELFADQAQFETTRLMESDDVRVSELNAWISHRAVNPDYRTDIPPLKAILFPVFTTGNMCQVTEISRAHAGMELMRAHFQSQSFEDHGFSTISRLVRELPIYLMVYNQFDQIGPLLENFSGRALKLTCD